MIKYILMVLFIGLAWGQKEYNIDHIEKQGVVYKKKFNDEIEEWVIDTLKGIGCDTARSVLNLSKDELIRRTDLEDETVEELLKILASEFDQD